jgi:hypothetical protein
MECGSLLPLSPRVPQLDTALLTFAPAVADAKRWQAPALQKGFGYNAAACSRSRRTSSGGRSLPPWQACSRSRRMPPSSIPLCSHLPPPLPMQSGGKPPHSKRDSVIESGRLAPALAAPLQGVGASAPKKKPPRAAPSFRGAVPASCRIRGNRRAISCLSPDATQRSPTYPAD